MVLPRGMAHHFSTTAACLYIFGAHGGILTSDFFVQDRGPKETVALYTQLFLCAESIRQSQGTS